MMLFRSSSSFDFTIVAFVVFCVVKALNTLKRELLGLELMKQPSAVALGRRRRLLG